MRIAVLCLVVALSLAIHGIECNNNLCLSQSNSPIDSYKIFIRNLRQKLTDRSFFGYHGIPILEYSPPNSERFHLINLTSTENDETITLAIDVVDASIAAYRSGNKSYFFPNAPQIASQILFTNTNQNIMDFDNTFQSIENAAGITRSEIPLGQVPLDLAISYLFRHELVPESFLVIIQMVIEASKFIFIQLNVINSIRDGNVFIPSLAILSLENNWSELSLQIQASASLQGLFGKEVLLYNSNDEPIEVDSVHYPILMANLVFQLDHCFDAIRQDKNKIIRMPSSVEGDTEENNNQCYLQARTTRISGREGLCVDVAGALVEDGSRVILYSCGQQVNQKWTVHKDKTIRSLGKCLATNTSKFGNSIVIYDCDKAWYGDIQWYISSYGRIVTYLDVMELTANAATIGTNLTGEPNTLASNQAWRVGNYVEPFIVSIVGLQDMCLEATNGNTAMWLENCVKNKMEQSWALYSDGTIRVNNNRSLCVTSSTDSSSNVITIRSCNEIINQRWMLLSDLTILNIQVNMVMDVAQNDVYLKKIILSSFTGKANQEWVILY